MTSSGLTSSSRYDVVVVGGGHNGLAAAAYLARAGLSVLVLERLDRVGGGAATVQPFAGRPTSFSRYANKVSRLPQRIAQELDLEVRLASTASASYTPYTRNGKARGLLVERPEGRATQTSFAELTDGNREYDAWCTFFLEVAALARVVAPTLLEPLPLEKEVAATVDEATWREFVTTPFADIVTRRFADDTVRGLVASAATHGGFAPLDSLAANRAFLYAMLGAEGTGEWRVPLGGTGALAEALARSAAEAGAELRIGCGVSAIRAGDDDNEVDFDTEYGRGTVGARYVLGNVAPWVLHILLGEPGDPETKPEGSLVTVDMLVDRLPRLRSGFDPAVALAGGLHVNQGYVALQRAHAAATSGRLPAHPPGTLSSAPLTDRSLLGDVPPGTHGLTWSGTHAPASLFAPDPNARRDEAVRLAIAALDEVLADPIHTVLARDEHGHPCLDARTPLDVEADLAMPGGHPHHGDLDWPWAPNRARLDAPDQAWGVATGYPRVLLASAGARRGAGLSGVAGHNAAHAVLASR